MARSPVLADVAEAVHFFLKFDIKSVGMGSAQKKLTLIVDGSVEIHKWFLGIVVLVLLFEAGSISSFLLRRTHASSLAPALLKAVVHSSVALSCPSSAVA